MRYYFGILFAVVILVIPWFAVNYPGDARTILLGIENAGNELANALVAHNPKTIADIQSRYNSAPSTFGTTAAKKVRILLVPGHEPDYGGAEFGSLKERNMTVELAQDLQQFLAGNPRYQVFVTRTEQSWNPTFANYFKTDWNDIVTWEQAHKNDIQTLTRLGEFTPITPDVLHNDAPTDVALRLYGIDKWVDENDIDIVIHIHFNDYPGHGAQVGKYTGFAIYVPQQEYSNSTTTQALADTIFKRLQKYNPVSDLPIESSGIVQDQDLIAVGAYNSVNAASLLVEYSYIYEPQFTDPSVRGTAIKDLAFQTFLGLQDFFDPYNAVSLSGSYDTLLVPHAWTTPITATNASSSDVYALQTALLLDGDYPPADKSISDCPRTGGFGPCTKSALQTFQKKYGITGESDIAGPKTLHLLNQKFGVRAI